MITKFEATNYGPIKSASTVLTPLHAFIGPNDSGKSTLLRGIATILFGASRKGAPYWPVSAPGKAAGIQAWLSGNSTYSIHSSVERGLWAAVETSGGSEGSINGWHASLGKLPAAERTWLEKGARIARFDADSLRQTSQLVSEQDALTFVDQRGRGLPGVFDLLNNRNDQSFQIISNELTNLFPTVKRLRLLTVSPTEKSLAIELQDGQVIDANGMSEGMLYYLAFAALQRLSGVAVLGVEEPETGLHPARIAEVVGILRRISESGTQVLIATHSPLVVNELKPEEVSVVTRTPEEGTKVRRIIDTPNFQKRSKVYALGELWISYANGLDEAPLLKGEPA